MNKIPTMQLYQLLIATSLILLADARGLKKVRSCATTTTTTEQPKRFGCGATPIKPILDVVTTGPYETTIKEGGGRVDNGIEAIPHSWPWQVFISFPVNSTLNDQCGGVILSENLVLTAAHCTGYRGNHTVYADIHSIENITEQSTQKRAGRHLVQHPDYTPWLGTNDIAYIKIDPPFEFNDHVQPICLPSNRLAVGQKCYVTGWGVDGKHDEKFENTTKLTQATQFISTDQQCYRDLAYDKKIQLCAQGPKVSRDDEKHAKHESTCAGDSGGPLVCQFTGVWHLEGIVSSGTNHKYICGSHVENPEQAIYTRASSFVDWFTPYM